MEERAYQLRRSEHPKHPEKPKISQRVASRVGSVIPLSIDHKPDRSDERQRIEKAGGFIIWAGTWRVGGVLAVSCAFGDKLLKPYVVADPEIQEEEIDGVDFIIIVSDGLWNVISNKEVVSLVQNITDAEEDFGVEG
ncbi:probable protein phosphatase 2C 11 [Vigna radiata var. radiata]|uniref:Probable protein phosphatase 2C 11 n=1 Tax=Vigna radiata var. radiata TaxID=3916 RepID=A0A1S3U0K9_VIGRR|nr:probable protein phosphatase 2C 11 [Vigna radiata var. radiata]